MGLFRRAIERVIGRVIIVVGLMASGAAAGAASGVPSGAAGGAATGVATGVATGQSSESNVWLGGTSVADGESVMHARHRIGDELTRVALSMADGGARAEETVLALSAALSWRAFHSCDVFVETVPLPSVAGTGRPRAVGRLCSGLRVGFGSSEGLSGGTSDGTHALSSAWRVWEQDRSNVGDAFGPPPPVLLMASSEAADFRPSAVSDREGGSVESGVKDLRAFQSGVNAFLAARRRGLLLMETRPPPRPRSPFLDALRARIDAGSTLVILDSSDDASFARSALELGILLYPHLDWRRISMGSDGARRVWRMTNGVRPLLLMLPGFREDDASDVLLLQSLCRPLVGAGVGVGVGVGVDVDDAESAWCRWLGGDALVRVGGSGEVFGSDGAGAGGGAGVGGGVGGGIGGGVGGGVVLRCLHGGRWKPEPGAWPSFRRWLARCGLKESSFRLIDHPLERMHEVRPPPEVAVVSGFDVEVLRDAEIGAMRASLERGFTVLVESSGRQSDFAVSVRDVLFDEWDGVKIERQHRWSDDVPVEWWTVMPGVSGEDADRVRRSPRGCGHLLIARTDISHALLGRRSELAGGLRTSSARAFALWLLSGQQAERVARDGE